MGNQSYFFLRNDDSVSYPTCTSTELNLLPSQLNTKAQQQLDIIHSYLFAVWHHGQIRTIFVGLSKFMERMNELVRMGYNLLFIISQYQSTPMLERMCGHGRMKRSATRGQFPFSLSHERAYKQSTHPLPEKDGVVTQDHSTKTWASRNIPKAFLHLIRSKVATHHPGYKISRSRTPDFRNFSESSNSAGRHNHSTTPI
jgi:hypothetical protein